MRSITFGLAFLLCTIWASSQKYSDQIKAMLKRSDVSTQTTKYFTEAAKFAHTQLVEKDKWENQYQETLKKANTNAEKFNAEFQRVILKNKERADLEKFVFKTVEYTSRVIMAPVESIPVWGPIQKEIDNRVFESANKLQEKNFGDKLAYSLNKLRLQNQARYDAILKSGDYDEVKKALTEVDFFVNASFEGVDPAYQEIVEKSQEKFLRSSVKSTLERVITDLGSQEVEIQELDERIVKLSKFSYEFAEQTNQRFKNLVTSQNELNTQLKGFYNEYKTDKKALDFMQDYLYGKMNPAERIQALQAGMLSDLTSSERVQKIKELELEQKKKEVIDRAKSYLNTTQMALTVLNNLGLAQDSKIVQGISDAVNIGSTVVSAVEAFTQGNYLEFVVGITGLFKKKGDDIATMRHKQIMQRFDQIDSTLNRIEKKVDILLQGQQQMLELQVRTYNLIDSLAFVIDLQHTEVLKRFSEIENALYENRQLILNDWQNKCQACLGTIQRLNLNVDQGILPTERVVKNAYTNLKEGQFKTCEEYINRYVFSLDQPQINPEFHLVSHINTYKSADNYRRLDTVNKISFNLLFQYHRKLGNLSDSSRYFYSLFFPATTNTDILSKINADSILFTSTYYPPNPQLYYDLVEPRIVERHGFVARNIAFLIGLTDINRNLISWRQFTSNNAPQHRDAKMEITNAIYLNNVAIAQQNILSGDILLPILFDESYQYLKGSRDTIFYQTSEYLLSINTLLAQNFINYYVEEYFRKEGTSLPQYDYALKSKNSALMNIILQAPYKITYIPSDDSRITKYHLKEGWYWQIKESFYSLPEAALLGKTALLHSQYLPNLLTNRSKLLQQLFAYELFDENNSTLNENINYMILKN